MLRIAACLVLCAAWACWAPDANAQEAHVYTRVYDLRLSATNGSDSRKNELVGSSFSLFHAGLVYDYIESVGELTIFEPARQQFTVINIQRMMMTTISFTEIENEMFRAQQKAELRLKEGTERGDPDILRTAGQLAFQLHPNFREQFSPQKKQLMLTSPYLSYDVRRYADTAAPELVTAYLQYTTWAARLNYLLHPQGIFPGPRLALNEVLQRRQLLPLEVELHVALKSGLHLRAEHQYAFKLDSSDRRRILVWESHRKDPGLKSVSFEEFRRVMLAPSDKLATGTRPASRR